MIQNIFITSDYDFNLAIREEYLQRMREGYLNGTYTEEDYIHSLSVNGFNDGEITQQLNNLRMLNSVKTGQLTRAQYIDGYFMGLFSVGFLVEKLRGLGYADESIAILLASEGVETDD